MGRARLVCCSGPLPAPMDNLCSTGGLGQNAQGLTLPWCCSSPWWCLPGPHHVLSEPLLPSTVSTVCLLPPASMVHSSFRTQCLPGTPPHPPEAKDSREAWSRDQERKTGRGVLIFTEGLFKVGRSVLIPYRQSPDWPQMAWRWGQLL